MKIRTSKTSINDTITEFQKANGSRLPLKKRKLRGNSGLACNEPLPKKVMSEFCQSHQPAMTPCKELFPSSAAASTSEVITQDIIMTMSSGADKVNRKILLREMKSHWRTRLGLSEIQFSNGLWLLARNKANVARQFKKNMDITSPILLKSSGDLADPQGLILADATMSTVNSPQSSKTTDARGGFSLKAPESHPAGERQKSWSKFLPTGIWGMALGPSYIYG